MLSHYYFYSSVRYIQQQKRESTNVVYAFMVEAQVR